MSLTKYERMNTFKVTVSFKSGSSYIDPSGSIAYLDVYKSDGTKLLDSTNNISGVKASTGIYYHYISTNSTDPLGIYVADFWGYFDYGSPWDHLPKHEREIFQLVYVD